MLFYFLVELNSVLSCFLFKTATCWSKRSPKCHSSSRSRRAAVVDLIPFGHELGYIAVVVDVVLESYYYVLLFLPLALFSDGGIVVDESGDGAEEAETQVFSIGPQVFSI